MPSKGKKQADVSFEDAVEKLESIVGEMESDELPLDKLLVRYEEGAKLVKACEEQLQSAETRIAQLEETLEGELAARPVTLRDDEE
jgi:exodeoxyribonuclease VII small subunit